MFLHGMELLSNKTYFKEIGLTIKIEAYIQYVIVFSKVLLMNTKEKIGMMTKRKDPRGTTKRKKGRKIIKVKLVET
jgi:hypothetical protein